MRVARALCALLLVVPCVPLVAAAGQHETIIAPARNPALPPEPPPPLIHPDFPRRYMIERPVTATLITLGEPRKAEPRNPALPPEPPGPLYFPDPFTTLRRPAGARAASPLQQSGEAVLKPQTKPTDGFVPVSELPPEEKLAAGPMLVGAYVFVVVALFAYVLSLARRVNAVGRDIARLDAQLKRR